MAEAAKTTEEQPAAAPKRNPRYRGPPEKFDPNFKHPNAGKGKAKKPAGPTSSSLPPPSNKAGMKNPTPTRDEPIFKEAIFGNNLTIHEINIRQFHTPSCANFVEVVNKMWLDMRSKNDTIDKSMFVEAVRYYSVAMLWLRMITIKRNNSVMLTIPEQDVLSLIGGTSYVVPEPVFLYLKTLGTIESSSTGQTLLPEFPSLPVTPINGFGGYYGAINAENHNLYEEIPALGVVAEGFRAALGDAQPGRYASSLDIAGVTVNSNLLGYEPLSNRRNEAKNNYLALGLANDLMPESVANTAFNVGVLHLVSQWMSAQRAFKCQNIVFSDLATNGSQCQTTMQRVEPRYGIRNIMSAVRVTSLNKSTVTEYGLGLYTMCNYFKATPPAQANATESQRAQTWCCQNYTGADAATTIPPEYIENMNERRNISAEYQAERFDIRTQDMSQWLQSIVSTMKQQ